LLYKIIVVSRDISISVITRYALFIILTLISFLVNDYQDKIASFGLFHLKILLSSVILYVSFLSTKKNHRNLLIGLWWFQIFAVFIKFLILGVSESGAIGTLSVDTGHLSVAYPLAWLPFFLFSEKLKYRHLYIISGLLFAIIGGKRAILVYLPVLIMIGIYLDKGKGIKFSLTAFLKSISIGIPTIIVVIYVAARLIPALNPDDKTGGKFSLSHLIEHSIGYNTAKYEIGFSRFDAPFFINYIFKENGGALSSGLGPGALISSSLKPSTYK